MTAVSPLGKDILSLVMPLEVIEDFAAELDEFIHLAHLGDIERAENVFHNVLKQHISYSFPILAEYLEFLLDNKEDVEVLAALDNVRENNFSDTERKFLHLVRIFSTCRLNTNLFSKQDAPCWKDVGFTLADLLSSALSRETSNRDVQCNDAGLKSHILEFSLSLQLLVWKQPKDERLASFFDKLEPIPSAVVFHQYCVPLVREKRFWEAHKLLLFVISQTPGPSGRQYFEEFARHISCHPPSWARRIAELAITAEYLSTLALDTYEAERQPFVPSCMFVQSTIVVESLLGIFFDSKAANRGVYEQKMTIAIELWLKNSGGLETVLSSLEVREALIPAMRDAATLPQEMRQVGEAIISANVSSTPRSASDLGMTASSSSTLSSTKIASFSTMSRTAKMNENLGLVFRSNRLFRSNRRTITKRAAACRECRRRKQKCDGNPKGCRLCKRRDIPCLYRLVADIQDDELWKDLQNKLSQSFQSKKTGADSITELDHELSTVLEFLSGDRDLLDAFVQQTHQKDAKSIATWLGLLPGRERPQPMALEEAIERLQQKYNRLPTNDHG